MIVVAREDDVFVDALDAHERVHDRADEARRSAEMVTRHFSRSLVSYAELDALDTSRTELCTYYMIASCLETVADQTVRVATVGEKLTEPLSDGRMAGRDTVDPGFDAGRWSRVLAVGPRSKRRQFGSQIGDQQRRDAVAMAVATGRTGWQRPVAGRLRPAFRTRRDAIRWPGCSLW